MKCNSGTPTLFVAVAMMGLAAGCADKIPVAADHAKPIPAAQPQTSVSQNRNSSPARPDTPIVSSNRTPGQNNRMSSAERGQLNKSLANLEDALFDYDKSTIRPDAMKALEADVNVIRTLLAKYPQESIRIEGHCDERGSAEYNLALGERRATVAKDFLSTAGVSAKQLSVISYGKEKPVCKDSSEECYQKNRRAHLEASLQ